MNLSAWRSTTECRFHWENKMCFSFCLVKIESQQMDTWINALILCIFDTFRLSSGVEKHKKFCNRTINIHKYLKYFTFLEIVFLFLELKLNIKSFERRSWLDLMLKRNNTLTKQILIERYVDHFVRACHSIDDILFSTWKFL